MSTWWVLWALAVSSAFASLVVQTVLMEMLAGQGFERLERRVRWVSAGLVGTITSTIVWWLTAP